MTRHCFSSFRSKLATCLTTAAIAFTMCFSANAAQVPPTITFGDLTDPSGLAVNGGVTVASIGITGVACANPVLSLVETCAVTGTLPNSIGVPEGVTITNINIYEPNGVDISDTLTITTTHVTVGDLVTPSTFAALFTSDSGLPLTPLIGNLLGGDKLTENGSAMNVFTTGGLTFQVASDVSSVPEPSAMALLGSGMSGLSLLGLYRRKRSEAKIQ